MVDGLAHIEEGAETLPPRSRRHRSPKKSRKSAHARKTHTGVRQEALGEQVKEGPERSKIFKRERELQGSLFVAGFIFWLFILLVGSILFITIRRYY